MSDGAAGSVRPPAATTPSAAAGAIVNFPSTEPVATRGTGAGGGHEIAHHKYWLRFTYDFIFSRPILSRAARVRGDATPPAAPTSSRHWLCSLCVIDSAAEIPMPLTLRLCAHGRKHDASVDSPFVLPQ